MPGIATQFVLLDLVTKRLDASNAEERVILNAFTAQPAYANLGAVGPDLFDFMPNNLAGSSGGLGDPESGTSPLTKFWQTVYGIANGTNGQPGLVATLAALNGLLSQLDAIADPSNQNLSQLEALQNNGTAAAGLQALKNLSTIVSNLSSEVPTLMANITATEKPVLNVPASALVPPPIAWDCRDFISWKGTGKFATNLINEATKSGDQRFIAYAYGYCVAYAAKVCGSSFMNSIVGSTYRLNWWRVRWLNMYGDAWVWGFYKSTTRPAFPANGGETPTPGYSTWPDLCSANLQTRIEISPLNATTLLNSTTAPASNPIPFPANQLPEDFCNFWFNIFTATFGTLPTGSRFTADGLNGAYLLTWLMLWLQTSGQVLGCSAAPPVVPPQTTCATTPPSWVTAITAPPSSSSSGSSSGPPALSPEQDPDTAEVVCGAILAVLGVVAAICGALGAGAASLAGGISLIISGESQINWENLRCQLYWYHLYLYQGLTALHEAAEFVGITHPYAAEFSEDTTTLQLMGSSFGPFASGAKVVKSQVIKLAITVADGPAPIFPAGLWDGIPASWVFDPTASPELPGTSAYLASEYPSFWIDDAANNPLSNGNITTPPQILPNGEPVSPVQFGNAVDNALAAMTLSSKDVLPDWNLDSDRGLGYATWQFTGAYSNPVTIEPE